jgi:hypothetical protein
MTNRSGCKYNHGIREFRFRTTFMSWGKEFWVHITKGGGLLKEFIVNDGDDNLVVEWVTVVQRVTTGLLFSFPSPSFPLFSFSLPSPLLSLPSISLLLGLFTYMLSSCYAILLPTLLCTHLLTFLISTTYPVVHASPHRSHMYHRTFCARIIVSVTCVVPRPLCLFHSINTGRSSCSMVDLTSWAIK